MTGAVDMTRHEIPPIVLLLDRHRDELARYSACFETSGFWVATTTLADEAIAAAEELKPDIIIADADGDANGDADGERATHHAIGALKSHPVLGRVPLIVLRAAGRQLELAAGDTVLTKPVAADALVQRTRELLERAKRARGTSDAIIARGRELVQDSVALRAANAARRALAADNSRPCPSCGAKLDWVERGTIGGVDYDYYRWCFKGCGLYCYNRDRDKWVKLA